LLYPFLKSPPSKPNSRRSADYRQQLQSVEQACESALSQVNTALMMLHHSDASQVGTFFDAINIKFATEAISILSPADATPTELIEPEPTAPTAPSAPTAPDVEPTIDVEVADATVTDLLIEPAAKATPPDIEGMLNKMTIQSIRKLAASCLSRRERDAGKHRCEVKENRHRVRYLGCHSLTQINN
jgi:hypothetical protein